MTLYRIWYQKGRMVDSFTSEKMVVELHDPDCRAFQVDVVEDKIEGDQGMS